jgi:hypothetical protein
LFISLVILVARARVVKPGWFAQPIGNPQKAHPTTLFADAPSFVGWLA